MADSILRLKVESQEYDNKLKRATEGIQRLASKIHDSQGEFVGLTDDQKEFIKNLQYMNTVSQTATGRVKELEAAYKGLQTMYNGFTAFEKNSEEGIILAEQLSILKEKTLQARKEMDDANKSLSDTGGFLDQLKSKFTVNIDALKLFDIGMKATGAALDVAKEAFFASETNIDEWGRVVASSESVYNSFLQSLNNGDFSGFISRIGEVINKATEAYNALDELGTRMSIINPERTRLQARTTELKAIIKRQGADSAAGKAATNELRQIEGMLTQAFKTESQLNMNAFKAKVDQKLAEAGIKLGKKDYAFLMRTFSSDASFLAMRRGARGSKGTDYIAGGSYDEGGVERYDNRNMNQKLLDLFTDKWRQENAALLNAAFSARGAAASSLLSNSRYLKEGGAGGGGGKGGGGDEFDISKIAFKVGKVEKLDPDRSWVSVFALMTEEAKKQMLGLNDAVEDLGDSLAKIGEKAVLQEVNDAIAKQKEAVEKTKKAWSDTGQAIGMVGNMMGSIKNPAAQTAGAVAQAIANIALAYSQALGEDGTIKSNIWYFIAATAAAMVSMATTISQIHSATGYAQGGIVEGNSYSGDNMMFGGDGLYGLNSGELVLTKAQQGNLASQLSGGAQNLRLDGIISGENIHIVHNRYLKRTGQGELLTWG